MTYVLPTRRHLVHKAIDMEKLSAKNAPRLDESTGLPCVAEYIYERKYDGCHTVIVIDYDLDVTFWSRDGKPVGSLGHHIHRLQHLAPGTVLFAEAWRPFAEFRQINGEFRRKSTQEQLELHIFDTVRLHEFEAGFSNVPYSKRKSNAWAIAVRIASSKVKAVESCYPWEVSKLAAMEDEAYDGAVARRKDGHWIAGAGTGGECLKMKNVVDVDLECVGIEEEHDKHGNPKGRLGAALFRFEGTTLGVYSGFNDDLRRTYWEDPSKIIGKIHRVVGMKASGKGSLREPRYKGARPDKDTPDY